ncbi:helix-turn-helix transcriptional regulator [bacterium]|nr:helix-turn-helix transcriptional regulator [bacterium]
MNRTYKLDISLVTGYLYIFLFFFYHFLNNMPNKVNTKIQGHPTEAVFFFFGSLFLFASALEQKEKVNKGRLKNANLTQETLAEKIGIAEKHYGKLERGSFTPSLETFFKLIEVLKIPFSELGCNLPNYENPLKENLAREIYSLNEAELKLYSEILQSIKEFSK